MVLGGIWAVAVVLAPTVALATDPLQLILQETAVHEGQAILDDETLSGIRGRGAEGPEISASGAGEFAVILWDELNQRHAQGPQGSGSSQSTGQGIVQSTSLVTRQY